MPRRRPTRRALAQRFSPVALACLGAIWAPPSAAVDYLWLGNTGAWETAANWQPALGTPGAGDSATVGAGNAALSSSRTLIGFSLNGGAVSGTGALIVSGAANWHAG